MQCPKCKGTLRVEQGGYGRANGTDGVRSVLPDSVSCMMCGYYKEILPEPYKVIRREDLIQNSYPSTRRDLGGPGWLKEVVRQYRKEINKLMAAGVKWRGVLEELKKVEPKLRHTSHDSLSNAYRRVSLEVNSARV